MHEYCPLIKDYCRKDCAWFDHENEMCTIWLIYAELAEKDKP